MNYNTLEDRRYAQALPHLAPSIVGWNRLESRPRSDDLNKSLSFEICDPLWMLTRQWQMGELRGEDTGSPVSARIKSSATRPDQVRLADHPVAVLDDAIPLEARAEREHPAINLRFGLEAGRLFAKYLARALAANAISRDYLGDFLAAWPLVMPTMNPASADVCAYQPVLELYAATAGRVINGRTLYATVRSGGDATAQLNPVPAGSDRTALKALLDTWFAALRTRYTLDEADDGGAWRAPALGYDLACSAPGFDGGARIVLSAPAYTGGRLDWQAFDIGPASDAVATPLAPGPAAPVEASVRDFIPTTVRFPGMPAARLWEIEGTAVNFGRITANITDLARLIFMEFGLVYGNDWFLFPLETKVGRIVRVDGLVVTDSFGERIWVPAFGQSGTQAWERWAVHVNTTATTGKPDNRLLVMADAIGDSQESQALEKVLFMRDETANMVFAVENRITLDDGLAIDGFEAAQARRRYLERLVAAPPPPANAPAGVTLDYKLVVDNVPENWIPFVPVQMPAGDNREIQLQRGAFLSKFGQGPVAPRTRILTPVDPALPLPQPYFLHEEEVPRGGVEVTRTFQRTRNAAGKPVVWCGLSRRAGRGEGSSGLAFDRIYPR